MSTGDEDEGERLSVEEIIWRRLYVKGEHRDVVRDEIEPGGYRISSGAFRSDQVDGVSVHRKLLTDEQTILTLHPGVGLGELSVADVESVEGLYVVANPLKDVEGEPDDPSHALIKPQPKSKKPKKLAGKTRLIRLPDALTGEEE